MLFMYVSFIANMFLADTYLEQLRAEISVTDHSDGQRCMIYKSSEISVDLALLKTSRASVSQHVEQPQMNMNIIIV